MATCNQRYQIEAQRKKDNARTRGLEQRPHAKGWVNRVTIVTPRKPNSAKRPVVKVFLRRGGRLTAHIPGIGHSLKKFSKILLRGRGPRDLPGVRYSGVRGVLDFLGLKRKKRRRSIYGAEQNNISKIRARRKYRVAIRVAERENNKKKDNEALLEQELPVNNAINVFLKKKKFKNSIIISNIKYNFFFLKNTLSSIENRVIYSYRDTLLNIYNTFLNVFNMYSIFSFFFVFLFNKFFFYKNTVFPSNACFFKITWYTRGKNSVSIFVSKFYFSKIYLLFFFNTKFKFYCSSLEGYYYNSAVFFTLPKRQLKSILIRKQFFFFLVSTTQKKIKSFFLKKIFPGNSSLYNDYELLTNLEFFFYKNQKLLFKKLSKAFFKNNIHFLADELDLENSLLLQVNSSFAKFVILKKVLYKNKYVIKRALSLKKIINTKVKFKYL